MKLLTSIFAALALLASPAFATCGKYMHGSCTPYTTGLSTVIQLAPLEYTESGLQFVNFNETDVYNLGFDEAVGLDGNNDPDTVYIQSLVPALVNSIKTLNSNQAATPSVIDGTTVRTAPKLITKTATVSSGAAAFYLTDNGGSGGTALCGNAVISSSVNLTVNDVANQYQYGWSISGDRKTLTASVNKVTTTTVVGISVLNGYGAAPNGTTVNLSVWCY